MLLNRTPLPLPLREVHLRLLIHLMLVNIIIAHLPAQVPQRNLPWRCYDHLCELAPIGLGALLLVHFRDVGHLTLVDPIEIHVELGGVLALKLIIIELALLFHERVVFQVFALGVHMIPMMNMNATRRILMNLKRTQA